MQGLLLLLVSLLLGLIFLILTVFAPSPLMVSTLLNIPLIPVILSITILSLMFHSMTWMTMILSLNRPLTLYMRLFFPLLLLWLILLPATFMP